MLQNLIKFLALFYFETLFETANVFRTFTLTFFPFSLSFFYSQPFVHRIFGRLNRIPVSPFYDDTGVLVNKFIEFRYSVPR